jgi:hypothetical protein
MAHYAFLDENNIVTEVIPGRDEWEEVDGITDWERAYSEVRGQVCKRTSYSTKHGQHINGGTPFRKNYAGIGYTYDVYWDAFIPPKPFASWKLDYEIFDWVAPIPKPDAGANYDWYWGEANKEWIKVNF